MKNKYIQNLQLSIEHIHLIYFDSKEQNSQIREKWLFYVLMTTAIVLWIIFNIIAIESYELPPYLLVVMNLILYCIVAAMISPDKYSDAKR